MRVQAAQKQESTDLIPIESVNAIELFTGGKLKGLLKQIETEVKDAPTDTSTDRSRKEIASVAYKVSRSKVVIDGAGKELVAEWKKQAAEVDEGRRTARTFLDDLRDKVRKPLTEWEEEQARIEAEEKLKAEIEAAHDEALQMDALLEREKEIERREAEAERKEVERLERERKAKKEAERKAEEERREREAKEREERAVKEAEERARREAEEALRKEREARERAELEAKEAAERERKRAAEEAEERERQRRAEEERKQREEEARAADKKNRERVNAAIIKAFTDYGVGKQTAEKVVSLVASGSIPGMTIRY